MNTPLPLLVLALAFLLGGCGSTMRTWSELDSSQSNSTKIGPSDTVSIILDQYRQYDDYKDVDSSSESEEQAFESCLSKSLLNQQAKLNILPAKEFRRAVFPDKEFLASPRSPEAIIELLSNDEFIERIAATHVNYLIILNSETYNTAKDWKIDCGAGGGGAGCFDYHRVWVRMSIIKATIIDMQHALKFGVAEANATGKAGYVIPIILIVPVPLPIPFSSATESRACAGLGQELGQKFFQTTTAVQGSQ